MVIKIKKSLLQRINESLQDCFLETPTKKQFEEINNAVAIETIDNMNDLISRIKISGDWEQGVEIINETLVDLSKKDIDLATEIVRLLQRKHSEIHQKYPFSCLNIDRVI